MKFSGTGAILLLSQLFSLAAGQIIVPAVPNVDPCPDACSITGPDPGNWTYYHSQADFKACNQTTLFELNVNNPIDDPDTHVSIRSCNSQGGTWTSDGGSCGESTSTTGDFILLSWGTTNLTDYATDLEAAITSLTEYLKNDAACPVGGISTNLLVRAGDLIAGVYLGSQIVPQSIALLLSNILQAGTSGAQLALEYCPGTDNTEIFGLFLDTTGDISAVQDALNGWTNAQCVGGSEYVTPWPNTQFSTFPQPLPDTGPKRMARRGSSCTAYTVASGDSCSAIGLKYGSVSAAQINTWNAQTWAWMGCNDLQIGQVICVSAGSPPMPAALQGANCGPQVPGTPQPSDISTLATLNPCAINACCNIWGQCGGTSDYCIPSGTGAPGTAAPGTNGCISNCGLDIIHSPVVSNFLRIGYFEGFNSQRPCNTMTPLAIPKDIYTHIYYAFATVDSGTFTVDVSQFQSTWTQFAGLKTAAVGMKKVVSIGGFTFSTDPSTYMIFRNAVAPANRQTFAQNVVNVSLFYS
jgi:chitinase